jgi:uncharacterized membrane protein YGL010W
MRTKETTMNMQELLAEYERNHESLLCKATHAVGIPLIVISLPLVLFKPKRALALFSLGWALQFVGHAIEGKPPKFFEGKQYFLAGLLWWLRLASAPIGAFRPRPPRD